MKNPLLLLHLDDDNTPVVINIEQVTKIIKEDIDDCTTICFASDDSICVKESPERIYNMSLSKFA